MNKMKKLILLLTICILTSCGTNLTSAPFIITGIEECTNCSISSYIIYVNNETKLFTSIKYNIGDTLK